MEKNQKTIINLPSPSYVCEESLLLNNLKLLKYVQDEADVSILLALKGFSLKSSFDLCREYLKGCCASGLNEALLAYEEFQGEVHTYSPAFKPNEFPKITEISYHIVFNSFAQLDLYKNDVKAVISLPVADSRLTRYLKGETLLIEEGEARGKKGWHLLCAEGYPLGFGKLVNGTLKNKYPAGWRV